MIELSTSFELACEIIDRDHRKLIDMVNAMVDAMAAGRAAECADLAPDFVSFAKQHFAREEALLSKVGYPGAKNHQEYHRSLDDKMDTILSLAESAGDNALARESLEKELVFFLMDDIINADLEFKAFVEGKGGNRKV